MSTAADKKPVFIISGATATGKTSTSILLANHIKEIIKKEAVIVNFDSLLFYRELNIGTAKPTQSELSKLTHEMIDIASISNPLNASDYIKIATPLIENILQKNKIPILVGGSGFYLRALIKGMYESPRTPIEIQNKINEKLKSDGILALRDELKTIDFESYQLYHENDHYRIVRALEHYHTTGEKISTQKKILEENAPYDFSINIHPTWKLKHYYLHIPKNEHLPIIELRTREMIKSGLVEEVQNLLTIHFSTKLKPLQSIGYKETIDYLAGELKSTDELLEKIVISTRQLAKSQRTWFNKISDKITLNPLIESNILLEDAISFLLNE